jgi:hypothetical protein
MSRISSFLIAAAVVVSGCVTAPSSLPYDESRPVGKACQFTPVQKGADWFAQVLRHPEGSQFASGAFGARLRVWVTYTKDRTELVTVNASPTEDLVRITGRDKIVWASAEKCEAFEPPGA